MSVTVVFVLLFAVLVYWLYTQILPEQQRSSLQRPSLGEGLITHLNERRRERGLPLLEMDEDLCTVAANKAVHQLMTGKDDEGWDYPEEYTELFGCSLLMEALFTGPMTSMVERMTRQRDVFDGEWITCGIGVAGGKSGQVVAALILCREAWEPAAEAAHHTKLAKSY